MPASATDGDVLEDEAARASTGLLLSTPAKAIVTAASSLLGETWTRTTEGTDWPVTVRHPARRVPDPRFWLRISLAPDVHMTLEPRGVSTKVSSTSPVAVPAGTAVTAVAVLRDSKVAAVPTWVMAAVVAVVVVAVDTSFGTAPMPAATTMMPTDAPMTPIQKRDSAGCPRRGYLLRPRRPISSMLSYESKPSRGPCRRCADMSVSFGAIVTISAQLAQFRNLTCRQWLRMNIEQILHSCVSPAQGRRRRRCRPRTRTPGVQPEASVGSRRDIT